MCVCVGGWVVGRCAHACTTYICMQVAQAGVGWCILLLYCTRSWTSATCAGGFSCHELALLHKLLSWWSSPATCAGGRCFSVINLHCVMVAVCMCVCVCVCLCVCIHVPDPHAKPSIKDYVLVKQRLRPSVLDTRVYRGADMNSDHWEVLQGQEGRSQCGEEMERTKKCHSGHSTVTPT